MVDNSVLDCLPAIKPTGLAVYAYLCKCADADGRCFPSQEKIGDVVGVKERQVRNILATLEDEGLIRVEKQFGSDARRVAYVVTGQYRQPITGNTGNTATNNRQWITGNEDQYRQPITGNTGNTATRNKVEQDPTNKTHVQHAACSAGATEVVDPELDAETNARRVYSTFFVQPGAEKGPLVRFHGIVVNREAEQAYLETLKGLVERGQIPTLEQVELAFDRACAWWATTTNRRKCKSAGPVLSELSQILDPAPGGGAAAPSRSAAYGPAAAKAQPALGSQLESLLGDLERSREGATV